MGFLQDSKGNFSSMRLINLLVVFTLCLNWSYSTRVYGSFAPSAELTALILGLVFGKVFQKKIEEKN